MSPNARSEIANHVWALVWVAALNRGMTAEQAGKLADDAANSCKF